MKLFSKPEKSNKLTQLTPVLCKNDLEGADEELEVRLRFDLKSDFGRSLPSDDGWQKLHARIMEREQQQAAQVFQPLAQRVPVRAWSGWSDLLPRLTQGFAVVLLFLLVHGVNAPNTAAPIDSVISRQAQTPHAIVSATSVSASQESRALRLAQDTMDKAMPDITAPASLAPSPLAERTNTVRALKAEAATTSVPLQPQPATPQIFARTPLGESEAVNSASRPDKTQPSYNKPE